MGDDGIFRRPAVPQPVRIRREIGKLPAGDRTLDWYEQGIRAMKARPLNDPRSWRYQAAIHDYPADVRTAATRRSPGPPDWDPNAVDTDVIPPDHTTFWRACQHNAWFFLPWHRMYLHFFEKIVAAHVAALGGPSDWALPYWNYSASPAAELLPPEFRVPSTPGRPNALFVTERTPNANAGQPFLNFNRFGQLDRANNPSTNLNCLHTRPFGQDAAGTGFGGPRIQHHDPRGFPGAVEGVPHNTVHGALGGSTGFMSFFSTAPLDPMFWVHHCNIDRLWETWVQRQKQLGNLDRNPKPQSPPLLAGWQETTFSFHDETGKAVDMAVSKVLDIRAAPLSYEYEDTSDPFNGVGP